MNYLSLSVFVAVVSVVSTAGAQSITVENPASLLRLDASGSAVAKRPLHLTPEGVSRDDCLADQRIRFPIALDQFAPDASVEAWAGAGVDCADPASRAGDRPACWSVSPGIPLQQLVQLDVPVRTLISGLGPPAGADVCANVEARTVDVQFLYFAPGDRATPAATARVSVPVDTVGPPALTNVRAASSAGSVTVSFDPAPTGVAGANVYCDADPTTALVPLAVPDAAFRARYLCASVAAASATSAVVTATSDGAQLSSGRTFTFAVTAVDAFGNDSPLSPTVAASPGPSDDGGGCAIARAARSPASGASGAVLALIAAALSFFGRRLRAV